MEATTRTTSTTNQAATDDAGNRLAALLQQGFSPSAAVDFAALELKDKLLARLRKMGLHEPSLSEIAAIQWKMDRLLASRGTSTIEVDVELRRDADGKPVVTLDAGNGFYLYVLDEDGLRAPAEEEIGALLARTTPVEDEETQFLDAPVEVRLDARGLPVAFVEDGYDRPDGRALDVILTPEGRTLADRPVLVEEYNTTDAFPGASVQ